MSRLLFLCRSSYLMIAFRSSFQCNGPVMLARLRSCSPKCVIFCAWLIAGLAILGQARQWNCAVSDYCSAFAPKDLSLKTTEPGGRFFLDNDSYDWVALARQMVLAEQWRVRYTLIDNTPYGREVHWSQSVMWLLVGSGYVAHLLTGEHMMAAIERASVWINPCLFAIFAAGFSWVIAMRMGVVAGTAFLLMSVSLPDLGWAFHALHLGHHGLHLACSFGTVLCLVLGGMGWIRRDCKANGGGCLSFYQPLQAPDRKLARNYFIAAGAFTGLGLWIGATVQFFSIAGLALAGVVLALLMPLDLTDEDAEYSPELWRMWGMVAASVGGVCYLIEYAPSHFSMRLEVNNPFLILSILCVGEMMVHLTRRGGGSDRTKRILLGAGALLFPLIVVLGLPQWHSFRNVEMRRLLNIIVEFLSYRNLNRGSPLADWFTQHYGLLPVSIIGALVLARSQRTLLCEWASLWISFCVCLLSLFLSLAQVRWAGLHAVVVLWMAVLVSHVAWRHFPEYRLGLAVAIAFALIAGGGFYVRDFARIRSIRRMQTIPQEFIDALVRKNIEESLGEVAKGRPMRILCDPQLVPSLYYYSGIAGVPSFYWENMDGLRDASLFFTDHGDSTAKAIAKRRGLTHLIVRPKKDLPEGFVYLRTGALDKSATSATLLARALRGDGLPGWITVDSILTDLSRREFMLRTPQGLVSIRNDWLIYRLQPENP